MAARRGAAGRWGLGLSVALLVNLTLLATVAFEIPRARSVRIVEPPPMVVRLERPVPRPLSRPLSKPLLEARTKGRSAPPMSLAPVAIQETPQTAPASPRPAKTTEPASAAPLPPGGEELQRVQAMLQKMRACADLYAGRRKDVAGCPPAGAPGGPPISGISVEDRMRFDADKRRAADLLQTNADLQRQTFAPRGDSVRAGCEFKHGKLHCGTY